MSEQFLHYSTGQQCHPFSEFHYVYASFDNLAAEIMKDGTLSLTANTDIQIGRISNRKMSKTWRDHLGH